MKKAALLIGLLVVFSMFFIACDNDSGSSYKFRGTVEISQDPDDGSGTVDLNYLAVTASYDGKMSFRAIVTNTNGDLLDVGVEWGTENIDLDYVEYSGNGKRMIFDVKGAGYQNGETVSVKARYGGVESSSKTVTFIRS